MAGEGHDILEMGSGNDRCYGGAGDDVLGGGIGDDTLWGGSSNDFLTGGQGNSDPLLGPVGVSGNDKLDGGEGNDSLQLNTRFSMGHSLFMSGGKGTDEFVIIANGYEREAWYLDLRSSSLFTLESLRFRFSTEPPLMSKTMTVHLSAAQFNGLSTFRGTNMDDRAERLVIDISGSAGFNGSVPQFVGLFNPLDDVRIVGATGAANQITGTRINDHIEGLGGNDRLTGLGGDDSLYGGDGNDSDTVTLRNPTAAALPACANYSHDLGQSALSGIETLRVEASGTLYQLLLNMDASTFATGWPTEIALLGDAASAALIHFTLHMGTETALNLSPVSFANWGGTVLNIDAASDAGKSIAGSHLADVITSGRGGGLTHLRDIMAVKPVKA